jgi:putative addiction module CopG family antidote
VEVAHEDFARVEVARVAVPLGPSLVVAITRVWFGFIDVRTGAAPKAWTGIIVAIATTRMAVARIFVAVARVVSPSRIIKHRHLQRGRLGGRKSALHVQLPGVYPDSMNVELTADQRAFVQRAIDSGRFSREEEAVREALALWEERERRRIEIIAMIDEADASLARGEGRVFTKESTPALVDAIKQRMRRRIADGRL